MSKKFFRPPPQAFDDDDDDSSSNASDHDELLAPDSNKRTVDANLSDDDDDDDDDEEEDDDDENEHDDEQVKDKKRQPPSSSTAGNGQRKAKKHKPSSFFELEAEASDDDDDDDDDDKGINDDDNNELRASTKKDDEQMDQEAIELMRQQDRRRAAAGGRFDERSVQEISRDIEQRHRLQNRTVHRSRIVERTAVAPQQRQQQQQSQQRQQAQQAQQQQKQRLNNDDDDDEPAVYTGAVAQQSLVPSVSDPSFWMVSCSTGKEQELVLQIMNKAVAFARQGKPLGISGAIAAQSKGKVYVESFSEPAVVEAIQGVRGLLQYTMRLVPIQDMTTVMTVVSHKKKPVRQNEWVRLTRGHYKGDLALVRAVKESGLKCIVQCVPRLDLTLADLPPEEARLRRRTVRPPQKFFSPPEVHALGRHSLKRQRFPGLDIYCDYFEGNYFHDGYLLKEVTVGSMAKPTGDDDPPSLDELQAFQRRKTKSGYHDDDDDNDHHEENENVGSKMAASLLDELSELQGRTVASKKAGAGLMMGDTVQVMEGDLVGLRGKLVGLDASTVKVRPMDSSIQTEIEFLTSQVRKYIAVGAHVKVTDGRYANETGTVVAVEEMDGDTTAVVLTDVTNKEISVRTSQLRESAEVASGRDMLSGYELYDLVVLSGGGSANEVGVIVRVGQEDFTVINNHGIAREARPEELRGKRNSTSNRAVALDVQGNQIRVGDTVNVAEGPHKGRAATIKRMSRAQLFLHSQTRTDHAGIFVVRSRSCVLSGSSQNRSSAAAPPHQQQQTSRGGPSRGRHDDGMVGKTVRITSGQWKGYIGTVADTTATHVQVELHSRLKKIMVVREKVMVIGDKFGATENAASEATNAAAANPIQAMATPMHAVGGATPAIHGFGGATPSHESGASDEVWRPGGSVDQDAIKDDGWGASDSYNNTSNTGTSPTTAIGTKDDGWGASSAATNSWGGQPPKTEEPSASTSSIPKQEVTAAPIKHEQAHDDMEETPVWFMDRVCVEIMGTDQKAVIKEIQPDNKSALVELEDKSTRTVRVGEVSMVLPSEHDTVLVAGGKEIGLEGSLVCVDGTLYRGFASYVGWRRFCVSIFTCTIVLYRSYNPPFCVCFEQDRMPF